MGTSFEIEGVLMNKSEKVFTVVGLPTQSIIETLLLETVLELAEKLEEQEAVQKLLKSIYDFRG